MDVKIIEDKNNVLLKRRELKFEVTFEGPTPTRMDVKNKMAALLNVPLELVVVQRMKNDSEDSWSMDTQRSMRMLPA
jgi:small subunit ribosomal protein S24e